MGRRHLAGLAELSRTPHMNCDLVAVCDPNRQNAEDLADEAHELLTDRGLDESRIHYDKFTIAADAAERSEA